MLLKDIPIKRKLITANLLTSGAVLLISCAAFFAYEYHIFRQTSVGQISSIGRVIAANSTAALAFADQEAANELLAAISSEPHLVAAVLYDTAGAPFAQFPANYTNEPLLIKPETEDYQFRETHLESYQPVVQESRNLGTLYLKSDLKALEDRFRLYTIIAFGVIVVASLLAYLLSHIFQKSISRPILALAETARAISERQDYTVRARKYGKDEFGELTDTFNHMLMRIQEQNQGLSNFNKKLEQMVQKRTSELELAIQEQKVAEKETYEANKELSQALEELRSTEEQLIEFNHELERRVQNRTKELLVSEEELKAKNQELEKTNIDLDNFIYTASHDLKSPIVNLEGLTFLMRKKFTGKDDSENNNLLNMVDTSVQKLKNTISDLAEITKVQKDITESAIKLSFQEIIEDVRGDIALSIKESGARIHVTLEVPYIEFPKNNLRSIIYNLLSNAIKYSTPESSPEISIRTYQENEMVVLSVKDNGLGLSEVQQDKLFTMFKRFHSHVDGTGIGLYIIKRIVENRGGKIEVSSSPGMGSTFKVYFQNGHNH